MYLAYYAQASGMSREIRIKEQRSEVGRRTMDEGRWTKGRFYPIFLPALLLIPNIIHPAWHESI